MSRTAAWAPGSARATRSNTNSRARTLHRAIFLGVAEVDLNVVCKNCGSEVSPYITECPYCGQRLRKRAPKLSRLDESGTVELAPAPRRRRFRRRRRTKEAERPLAWMSAQRPYATIALVLASTAVYLAYRAGVNDTGILVEPVNGEWWRLVTSQFNYDNVGYL